MKDNKYIKVFRILGGFFDLAIIYIVSALLILIPLVSVYTQLISNGSVYQETIVSLCLMIGIAIIISFLILFVPCLLFKGSTLGEKMFFLSFIKNDGVTLKIRDIFLRVILVLFFFIFTLGLSLISDIITIIVDTRGRTIVDRIVKIQAVKNTGREE